MEGRGEIWGGGGARRSGGGGGVLRGEGRGASICLPTWKCQGLLVLSERLPADVDLILHKRTAAKLCGSAHQTERTHVHLQKHAAGALGVQETTSACKMP